MNAFVPYRSKHLVISPVADFRVTYKDKVTLKKYDFV